MISLPTQFTKSGWTFTQLQRHGKNALYVKRKTLPGASREIQSFEVIVIESHPEIERFGKIYPAAEMYPYSELWGSKGWTFVDKVGALGRMMDLEEEGP